MLVTMKRWEEIRGLFNEQEKKMLNDAITGETICPRGVVIDTAKVNIRLVERIKGAKPQCP